jgi:kynurenine formamidase
MFTRLTMIALIGLASRSGAQAIDFSRYKIVDLTYALNAQTLYWPTSPTSFKLEQISKGKTPGGWFYSAYQFSAPEHGGTHIDAPIHFSESGASTDRVPLTKLMGPAVVIDVRTQSTGNADYRLTPDDITRFEKANGRIKPGSIVLLRTGWSARWPNRKAYFGDDTPNDATKLHFPSFGVDAAKLLVNDRKIAALGVDVASIDYGPSTDFMVHRVTSAAGVPGLENLTNLQQLPPTGATIIALPMKIEGGSGGPVRVVALVPNR